MGNQNSRRYLFDASAAGVAGQFVQPSDVSIPIQAASALPSDGGFSSADVGGFQNKFLSFRSAHTEVRGREIEDGVFETVALSEVTDFNLLGDVKCARIVGQLVGRHRIGPGVPAENLIVPTESRFIGLSIRGDDFPEINVAPDFFNALEHASWTGLLRALENDGDRSFLAALSLPADDIDPVSLMFAGQRAHLLGFRIALNPRPGFEQGNPLSFDLPNFGTVHLGEFFCQPTSRRLIMLRAELNGDVQGRVVVGDPIVNGTGYPPG